MVANRLWRSYFFAILFFAGAIFVSLRIGVSDAVTWDLVSQFRIPRVILAAAVGMGLAVAGTTLQAIFANPLCEPYTLGISSGAALGAVSGTSLGLSLAVSGVAGSAFLGALVFTLILYLLGMKRRSGPLSLLLTGVMLGFLGSSLVALWMAMADSTGIEGALFWLLGDLSRARLAGSLFVFGGCFGIASLIFFESKDLDALLLGRDVARSLGVSTNRAERRFVFLTSILVAFCVAGAGMIGFIGLVVPHFVRQRVGSIHRRVLPLAGIWGATALVLADLLARTLADPYELPVGVVTALVGAPLFVWLLLKRGRFQV